MKDGEGIKDAPASSERSGNHHRQIALLSAEDPRDPLAWSGSIVGMSAALSSAGLEIAPVGPLNVRRWTRLRTGVLKVIYRYLLGTEYARDRHPAYLRDLARDAQRLLAGQNYDAIISPSSMPIADLETDAPILFWTDATYDGMIDFYPGMKNLCRRSLREGHDGEQKALDRCAYALYASEWARDTAIAHYEVAPDKVKFIRFGANIPKLPSRAEVESFIAKRDPSCIRFVLIGVDWERKGGDVAVEVVRQLRARGIPAQLHVLGTTPPQGLSDYVINEGFIPKNDPKGLDRFNALLASAHFSILPSRAECYGVAPVEAAAFGVPSLVTNVGGLPSAVLQGKTGYLFDLDAPAALYCDRVEALLADPETYRDFCLCAHDTFRSTLSWAVSGPQVAGLIDEFSSREVASPENR